MRSERYDELTPKEKMMFDELAGFAKRLAERQEEIIELLKTILAEAHSD